MTSWWRRPDRDTNGRDPGTSRKPSKAEEMLDHAIDQLISVNEEAHRVVTELVEQIEREGVGGERK